MGITTKSYILEVEYKCDNCGKIKIKKNKGEGFPEGDEAEAAFMLLSAVVCSDKCDKEIRSKGARGMILKI